MSVSFTRFVVFSVFVGSLSHGKSGFGPTDQDWGYITVRDRAHMFWWLHYTTATGNYTQRPLVIWLQGGPGGSSTGIGNFHEIGPLDVNQKTRNISWVQYLNVLFVDNPVGTGYSYVENSSDTSLFANNNSVIAEDFFSLLKGFLNEKSEFQQVPLYIFGQSYGGKMTVDIALKLYEEIQAGNIKCNFKGIGLGNSWISPIDSLRNWPPYLLNLGFIDTEGHGILDKITNTAKVEIDSGNFSMATAYFRATQVFINRLTAVDYYNILEPIKAKTASKYRDWKEAENETVVQNIFKSLNIDIEDNYESQNRYTKVGDHEDNDNKLFHLMNGKVKKALGLKSIPIQWGEQSDLVFQAVNIDFMKSVTENLERILNETNIKVTVYSGQLDLIVCTPGTISWVNNLKWPGAEDWKNAKRAEIVINGINEGYSKSYGNFNFFWINRAGHAVPKDNPHAMQYVLSKTVDSANTNLV